MARKKAATADAPKIPDLPEMPDVRDVPDVPQEDGVVRQTRSQKTRAILLQAARMVFERDGYFDARIEDIVAESHVARGTFYTYFKSKGEILAILQDELSQRLSDGSRLPLETLLADPLDCIRQFIIRFFDVYSETARMQEIITQVATVDEGAREHRLRVRREHVEHLAHAIALWQYNGIADKTLDPALTGAALASMLTNFAFWVFIGGDVQDRARLIDTIYGLWVNALAMPHDAAAIMAQRRSEGLLGPQVGLTDDHGEAANKPLARRGYWK